MNPTPQDKEKAEEIVREARQYLQLNCADFQGQPDCGACRVTSFLRVSITKSVADERERLAKGLMESIEPFEEPDTAIFPPGSPTYCRGEGYNAAIAAMSTYLKSQGCDLKE